MTTIRVAKRKRFTMISRETVNDARLSFRARGVLAWLLDKPDDWSADSETIASEGREGRDAVRTALNELATCGYLTREKKHDNRGHWYTEWTVFERPPATENQGLENRPSENQALRDQRLIQKLEAASQSADPNCVRCQGRGTYYRAGAGIDARCECTEAPCAKTPNVTSIETRRSAAPNTGSPNADEPSNMRAPKINKTPM